MGKKEILNKTKYKLPWWATTTAIVFLIFVNRGDVNSVELVSNFAAFVGSLISAKYTYQFARRLDKKGIFAILFGLTFSLLGLLIYWVYYRIRIESILGKK